MSHLSFTASQSVDYLVGQVAAGRESYYTGAVAAGEPPGRWSGRGAEALGLVGEVDDETMKAVYEHWIDPRDPAFRTPAEWGDVAVLGVKRRYRTAEELYETAVAREPEATPERRAELRAQAQKNAKGGNVPFYDATFNVQKSITVLHATFEAQEVAARSAGQDAAAAAWAEHRQVVEDAIWTGNQATLDYLSNKAGYARVGHHGGHAGRWTDAHNWVVASFFQHDNRDHDPHLHIHNAILARVQCADGQWRGLDSRAAGKYHRAANAAGERAMEEYLTRVLGIEFVTRPDGLSREVRDIPPGVLDLFSKRRRALSPKAAELVDAYTRKWGHEPSAAMRARLARQATLATRRAKSHTGETVEERLERWDTELAAEISGGLATVAETVLSRRQAAPRAPDFSPSQVLATALDEVQSAKAAWTETDLAVAVSAALPDHLGGLDADEITCLVDGLTTEGLSEAVRLDEDGPAEDSLPQELRLANGDSVYNPPGARIYALPGHLAAERALRSSAVERGAPALSSEQVDAFVAELVEQGIELGADQAAAVRGVLTSGADVEALVGPAGTGKSFVLGAVAKAWTDPDLATGQQRRVFGLATSQVAAEVLAGEGLQAANISRWLGTQQRIGVGQARADGPDWMLHSGDLVIVDESAMTSTHDLIAVRRIADQAGAKMLLSGDHRQLAAVGAGGGMQLVAEQQSYELADVRRFSQQWERDASLRLREGDAAVLHDYRLHGRLIDGGTLEQATSTAVRGYLADVLDGRRSLLITESNELAAQLSAAVRAELVRLGRVAEKGVELAAEGTTAGVGDLVQARRNGWELAGRHGNRRGPLNRETYQVVATHTDGSLVVTTDGGPASGSASGAGERITLPACYVAEHLALGYAATAHAAQGQTVDTSHTVATGQPNLAGLYVPLSRGRDTNTAYVVTLAVADDAPPGTAHQAERRDPADVLRTAFEAEELTEASAVAEAEGHAAEAATLRAPAERFADVAELATAGRTATFLDELVAAGQLSDAYRQQLASDPEMPTVARLLRRAEVAGHDPRQVLTEAVTTRSFAGARSLVRTLDHRITSNTEVSLEPSGDSYSDWLPAVEHTGYAAHLSELAALADARRDELGQAAVTHAPQWAVEALGPVPDDPTDRADWQHRAGQVAAVRERASFDSDDEPLPPRPEPGRVEAHAAWAAAARAIGYDEQLRDETEMSDGQLLARVRAWEREKSWAPAYVAYDLSGTAQAEQRHTETAALRHAEAEQTTTSEDRDRLEQEANEAADLAAILAGRRADLATADEIRGRWYAHTAETRGAHERATGELQSRGVNPEAPVDALSPAEWLAAHAAADQADDAHRPITDEHEFTDIAQARADDQATPTTTAAPGEATADGPEDTNTDLRARTHDEDRPQVIEDWTRVPNQDEAADTVARAQRALAELEQRTTLDQQAPTDPALPPPSPAPATAAASRGTDHAAAYS